MTHRRLPAALLLFVVVLGIAAGGCSNLASPSGWTSPTLTNGLLLVAHKDKLYALDPATLDAHWRFPPEGGKNNPKPIALYGTPGATSSTVFIPGYNGKLYGAAATSGELSTKVFDTGGPLVGGVVLSGTTAYFGSSDGKVYALNTDSGQQLWAFPTDKEVWSTPTLAGDTLYVTSLDGHLYALDAAAGSVRWSFEASAALASPAVVDSAAGLVYLAGFDGRLRAVDLQTHHQRWAIKAGNWFWTRPLVDGGVVYAGSLDHKVYAADTATGVSPWAKPFSAKAPVRAVPLMAGGKLIVVDRGGHVYALNPRDGTATTVAPLALGADVLADPLVLPDGKILFVTTGGEMIRVDPATLTIVDSKKLA